MSNRFETMFTLDLPIEQAWKAFTEPDYLETWLGSIQECDIRKGGRIRFTIPQHGELVWLITEAEPPRRLTWSEPPAAVPSQRRTTVTFGEMGNATRIHVIESGFGDGVEWQGHLDGTRQGWANSLAGLHLYLRTGVRVDRMYTFRSGIGAHLVETPAGVEVVTVTPGSFAAKAGLHAGDIVLWLGRAPIFALGDVWLFTREHDAGEETVVTYVRDGALRTGQATLGEP